jgi:tellurite methyltransferase
MKNARLMFRTSGGYSYPAEPRQQVVDLMGVLNEHANVLDIGAGFGNNVLPLVGVGHSVTATETNEECITYLEDLRSQYPDRLTVLDEPIQKLKPSQAYDAVVCTMVLQFLAEREAKDAIDAMQNSTRRGGYNVIVNYLAGQTIGSEYTWLVRPRELLKYYHGWEIISYEEGYPLTIGKIRSIKQFLRWILGRRGYKSAKLIARRPTYN